MFRKHTFQKEVENNN